MQTEPLTAPGEWGRNVKGRRIDMHMTQRQLADAVGVTSTSISRIERGVEIPRYGLMVKLAVALRWELDRLFPYPKVHGR